MTFKNSDKDGIIWVYCQYYRKIWIICKTGVASIIILYFLSPWAYTPPMRFLLSILMIAILLSGYKVASHVMIEGVTQKASVETASFLPCTDHHANESSDGKTPSFDANCHHCGSFPIGAAVSIQKADYPHKAVFMSARRAFLPNGLTFPLLRPPQSRA